MRVLYVEDDDNLAFAVEQMLRQDGHNCDRVRSGAGAVKLGQTNDYDVILLDVMLPDIDGYEVIRLLQGAGVDTPVLIQSGLVERDKAMDGLGFGVDDYLIKPFNRDELIRQVRQAAARSGKASPSTDDEMSVKRLAPPTANAAIALPDERTTKPASEPTTETASEPTVETSRESTAEIGVGPGAETAIEQGANTAVEPAAETPVETSEESTVLG